MNLYIEKMINTGKVAKAPGISEWPGDFDSSPDKAIPLKTVSMKVTTEQPDWFPTGYYLPAGVEGTVEVGMPRNEDDQVINRMSEESTFTTNCLGSVTGNMETGVMLRSTVGKTHVLRSGLVMDYTTSYFPLIVLGYPLDSKRSYGPLSDTLCPGA